MVSAQRIKTYLCISLEGARLPHELSNHRPALIFSPWQIWQGGCTFRPEGVVQVVIRWAAVEQNINPVIDPAEKKSL